MLIYKKNINTKIANLTFILINTILFIGYYINDYYRKGFVESLTFDQISPFTFTMISASFLMNKKTKEYFLSSVAFLSIGMLIAMIVSPQQAYLVSYRLDANMLYVLDTLLHLNCSLFGIFLVSSIFCFLLLFLPCAGLSPFACTHTPYARAYILQRYRNKIKNQNYDDAKSSFPPRGSAK